MNTEIIKNGTAPLPTAVEAALIDGDLAKLNVEQRVAYYNRTCETVGLNPMTQPFNYIVLKGKLRLYAKKDCTEQLRKIHKVSIRIASRELKDGLYIVTAVAKTPDGREDENIGALPVTGLKGEDLANALMKCETKAKRRVTLSICGLGWLDESETDTMRDAKIVSPDWSPGPSALIPEFELPESTKRQLEPPKCELEPLENPWLYKITRRGITKYLAEVEPKWFNNIVARYGHGQMTEEEYVNAAACLDQPWLKDVALEEIANERSEQEGQ